MGLTVECALGEIPRAGVVVLGQSRESTNIALRCMANLRSSAASDQTFSSTDGVAAAVTALRRNALDDNLLRGGV